MVVFGVRCTVIKNGGHDIYGEKIEGAHYRDRCAVVKLKSISHRTTVRVDAGATRGGAEESRATAILLMPTTTRATMDDFLKVDGHATLFRITGVRHRFNVMGRLDHYEIEAEIES